MLHLILTVLKIIGLILLVILGLVLLCLLCVLFSAVGYRISGSCYEKKPKGEGHIWWLFHILSVKAAFDEEIQVCVRLFGIPVKRFPSPEETVSEETVSEETAPPAAEDMEDGSETILSTTEAAPVENQEPIKSTQETIRNTATEPTAEPTADSGKYDFLHKKLVLLMEKLQKAKAWWEQEDTQKTRRLILRQLKKIVKHIIPKKAEGKIRFGFDDPYRTGQVLSLLSICYPWYQDSLQVTPVFDENILEGECRIRGRIRIGVLIGYAVRLLFNKNIRILIQKVLSR